MNQPFLQIIDQDLCAVDPTDKSILKKFNPKHQIRDFKQIGDRIIIQENVSASSDQSNIYCLDSEFNLLWVSELPWPKDCYPNPIVWNSRINETAALQDNFYKKDSRMFTTASKKGITVSIDYTSGKIESSLFTK